MNNSYNNNYQQLTANDHQQQFQQYRPYQNLQTQQQFVPSQPPVYNYYQVHENGASYQNNRGKQQYQQQGQQQNQGSKN